MRDGNTFLLKAFSVNFYNAGTWLPLNVDDNLQSLNIWKRHKSRLKVIFFSNPPRSWFEVDFQVFLTSLFYIFAVVSGVLRSLWQHGGPTAPFLHLVIAFCLLLPKVTMEAKLIEAGFLSQGKIEILASFVCSVLFVCEQVSVRSTGVSKKKKGKFAHFASEGGVPRSQYCCF